MPRPNTADLALYERGVLIRLTGVDAGYGADIVLFGVDFEIRTGEVSLVSGPQAAGKTTLMHLLRLSLAPRAGRMVAFGADVARAGPRAQARIKRRIGYVAENPVFVEQWTAFDNIALPLKMSGQRARDYAHDVKELVDFVGLEPVAARLPVEKLSGAERRRAAIARALASKPELILADDPTAGMSPGEGRRIVRLLAEMRRVNAGVVIASQDESLAECAPILRWRMERGRLSPIDHPADAEAIE